MCQRERERERERETETERETERESHFIDIDCQQWMCTSMKPTFAHHITWA